MLTWLTCRFQANANPTGGTVTHGSATFNSSGSQFTINQGSANAVINWQSFNIAPGQTTTFNQPSANSVAWNQINDANPSQILGNLNANGYVILENANGFYIGGQAVIDTHGLVMTTASTPPPDFSTGGPWSFAAPPPTARIQNFGQINITGGGTAYLIAADIVNGGTINAPNGHIGLYDGETVLVSTSPNGQGLSAAVTLPQGSVDNEGKLTANGGSVVAQAQFVNQNGVIQANTAQNVNGTIELLGSSSVALGANSAISAQGSAQGISSGGSVTIQAGNAFSDLVGSTISIAGGAQGGHGGQVEISALQMGAINTVINGQAVNGFTGGTLTIDPSDIWLDSVNTAPVGYTFVDINSFSGMSQINLLASDNIALNTLWPLVDQTTPSTLSLTAGNNIIFEDNGAFAKNGIQVGQNWSVNLMAGTAFVPTVGQPKPASGSDGIYLEGGSYLQAQNGDINLWAANEVQVGWSGAAFGSQVNSGAGFVTTLNSGNINVTAVYGDVNTGSDPVGYVYSGSNPNITVSANVGGINTLGGISTAAGGNVTINAGGNVISYLPTGNTSTAAEDGGTGAFGPGDAGNVTINAGGSVYGHYVVADGTGTIIAGQNVGAAAGNPFALSLMAGSWNVNAPNGNIYLQEVRNPNGVFNSKSGKEKHLFNYGADASVDLTAYGVFLTGQSVPRPFGAVPVLYPPILDITAGAGGVTLGASVILFPSPDQNLDITTTDGGNFTGIPASTGVPELLMSDSARVQFTSSGNFGDTDHGTLANEPSDTDPVFINISGDMVNLNLFTTKVTDIMVGGDMINCGFSGQNLQASDITSINVAGQIFNTSAFSFVTLAQAIPNLPAGDLFPGMTASWDNIFALAVDPTEIAGLTVPANITASQLASYAWSLGHSAVFGATLNPASHIPQGGNPGFVYNQTTGQLGFGGQMASGVQSALTQPLTILHLVNGQAVIDQNKGDNSPGRTFGQIETDTINWGGAPAVGTLFTDSQGAPSPNSPQLGLRIGGPGAFDINAGSISLGNTYGILSCGVEDAQGGKSRYANLASITPSGATLNISAAGDLDMLTSTIATLGGGDVNVASTGGSIDLGSPALSDVERSLSFGIFSTGGGNVNVTALGEVNIDGSRIATANVGNISVESYQGSVDIGTGGNSVNQVSVSFVNPATGKADNYTESIYGSGILAITLVPPQQGQTIPPNPASSPGNVTVMTPQGDIIADAAGVIQEALDGSIAPGPTILMEAGTPYNDDWTPYLEGIRPSQSPISVGNINTGNSGVIGGNIILLATGNISSQGIVARQNTTVTAQQNVNVTLVSGGQSDVSGQTVQGTIVGVGGVNVSGQTSATLLGQNVSQNGNTATSTLGSSATATSSTQSAAQQANSQSQQQASADTAQNEDKNKKKTQIRKVGHVTVILASAQ